MRARVQPQRWMAHAVGILAAVTLAWTMGCGDDGGGSGGLAAACKANCAPHAACGGVPVAECQSDCDEMVAFAQMFGMPAACNNAAAAMYRCLADITDCDEREAAENEEAGNVCEGSQKAQEDACTFSG